MTPARCPGEDKKRNGHFRIEMSTHRVFPCAEGINVLDIGNVVPRVCAATVYDDREQVVHVLLPLLPRRLLVHVRRHVDGHGKLEPTDVLCKGVLTVRSTVPDTAGVVACAQASVIPIWHRLNRFVGSIPTIIYGNASGQDNTNIHVHVGPEHNICL